MGASIDKNYKISVLSSTVISKTSFTQIFNYIGRGWLDSIVLAVNDTDMKIVIEIDGVNVLDEFILKDFKSNYNMDDKIDYNLPFSPIGGKSFRYRLKDYQQFDSNVTIKLKHNKKNNKKLEAGYITYQER